MQVPTLDMTLYSLRRTCGEKCRCATALESYGKLYADDDEVVGELAVMALNLSGRIPPFASSSPVRSSAMADLRAIAEPPFPSRLIPEEYGLHKETGVHA